MLARLRAIYYWLCDYPRGNWWPVARIFGGPGRDTVYLTRVKLTPPTRWGQLYLHIFHREDLDRDPHDHPFDFWTLPLSQGYAEDVYAASGECFTRQRVPHFKLSYRPAEHTHRVVATDNGRWPLVTIVWRGPSRRKWGFWVHAWDRLESTRRSWVVWTEYLYGGEARNANVPGRDVDCPGTKREYVNWSRN
jgi:hypothetical protein